MSLSFTVLGESTSLKINVLAYENGEAQDVDDANWLRCFVEFASVDVSARYPTALTTCELKYIESQLINVLSNTGNSMSYVADEDGLELRIRSGKLGDIKIEGVCRVVGPPKVTLSFSFRSDQTLIKKMLSEIQAVLQRFPVKIYGVTH